MTRCTSSTRDAVRTTITSCATGRRVSSHKVDPDKLCIRRATEHVLVPESDADLGAGFGVHYSPDETWVITSEIPTRGTRNYNRVLLARIIWSKPNRLLAPQR